MSKHITSFNTYADYSASTLTPPNVSVIKNSLEIIYKDVEVGNTFGDVLMYDVANDKLVSTYNALWNTDLYPISSFMPIAVNVYPKSMTNDGNSRWLAIRWADNESDGGSSTNKYLAWGSNSLNTSFDKNALNGRENTDIALQAADGTTANTPSACASFAACNRFVTSGTSQGDWYLPSFGELSIYISSWDNMDKITKQMNKIKAADSSIVTDVLPYQSGDYMVYTLQTSTVYDATSILCVEIVNGGQNYNNKGKESTTTSWGGVGVHPMLSF